MCRIYCRTDLLRRSSKGSSLVPCLPLSPSSPSFRSLAAGNILKKTNRKQSESFQADLFPPALSNTAALSSTEWFGGKTCQPKLIDLESRQISSAVSKPTPSSSTPAPTPVVKKEEVKKEEVKREENKVEEKKEEVTIFNVPIRKDSPSPESTSPEFDDAPTLSASDLIAKSNGATAAPTPTTISTQSLSIKESYGVVSPNSTRGEKEKEKEKKQEEVKVKEVAKEVKEGEGEVVQLRKRNEELKRENERLKGQVAESNIAIRYLELRLEKVKSAMSA